jgi:Icc protein
VVVENSAPLRVIQISDTHIQAQPHGQLGGVDVDAGLTAVLDHLRQHHWPADFILATGDLVQDEGAPAYQRLRAFFEPLQVPVYCLPGNHDIPAVLDDVLADGLMRRERHVLAGAWQFVLLDSVLPDSAGGHLAASELAFLDETLAAYPKHHAMICLHHHPVPVGSTWMDTMVVDNGAELFAVLDRYPQVRAVIWGHIHQVFATRRNGVELFGVPSTCVQFAPALSEPQYDHDAPGYRWFELYPDGRLATGVRRAPLAAPAQSQ